jgi:hypothetical protein
MKRGTKMEKQTIVIEKKSGKYAEGNEDFNRLSWVVKARSNYESRLHINGVNFSCGVAIATDRHRLHMACIEREIPDGNYIVKSATGKLIVLETDTADFAYPDVERLWRKRQRPAVFYNYSKDMAALLMPLMK